jgi:hypothetical protein
MWPDFDPSRVRELICKTGTDLMRQEKTPVNSAPVDNLLAVRRIHSKYAAGQQIFHAPVAFYECRFGPFPDKIIPFCTVSGKTCNSQITNNLSWETQKTSIANGGDTRILLDNECAKQYQVGKMVGW